VAGVGPHDQASIERLRSVLVYSSEPCDEARRLAGDIHATLHVASDAAEARYSIRVNAVVGDRSLNIADGLADADGLTRGPVRLEVDCGPVAATLPAGASIRVCVSGALLPNVSPHPQRPGVRDFDADPLTGWGASHAVFHDREHPSCITLPFVDPPEARP
jgi:predicted acyl esterase